MTDGRKIRYGTINGTMRGKIRGTTPGQRRTGGASGDGGSGIRGSGRFGMGRRRGGGRFGFARRRGRRLGRRRGCGRAAAQAQASAPLNHESGFEPAPGCVGVGGVSGDGGASVPRAHVSTS